MSENELRRDGPYAAISCGMFRHRKFLKISPLARLLHIAAICYCADELTDGHIEPEALGHLYLDAGANKKHLHELENIGLWKGHGPWQIHDYLDWNPSKAWWDERRRRDREKKAAQRRKQQMSPGDTPEDSPGESAEESPTEKRREEKRELKQLRSVASPATDSHATLPSNQPPNPVRPTGYGELVMADPTTLGGELEALMGRLKEAGA